MKKEVLYGVIECLDWSKMKILPLTAALGQGNIAGFINERGEKYKNIAACL